MSVQSEITRLSDNVTAALAAIADKGVTVPDGSNSDSLASLIAAIEAGVGAKIATGTAVPANDKGITIEHGLGEVPNVFFWCITDFVNHTTTDNSGGVIVTSRGNNDTLCGGHIDGQSFVIRTYGTQSDFYRYFLYSNNQDMYSRKIYRLTSNNITSDCDMLAYYMAGETVRWVAMVI